MAYRSIVLVKQVPDTANITAEAMKEDGTVNRAALPTIFNPEDLHALEAALEVKDRFGGTVTAITMGPPKAADVLRDCLFRGADRAILLTDRRAGGSDTLATSYILSQAVKTVGNYDFVFCGRQAIDGDTAQTGPQCAEKLNIPQVTYLEEIVNIQGNIAELKRNIGHGWEIVKVRLPCLATVVETANTPRPWSAKRMMRNKAKQAPAEIPAATSERLEQLKQQGKLLEQWGLDDISADIDRCGLSGSPTKVFRIQSIVLKKEGFTEIEPTETGVRRLIRELVGDRTLG
ncbi:MAG: electron transfer flavoprotein subunit beta/FixA family protein [Planctomycetaceae bacterium]|jgi:electron transfer flavoprotein beta subunit|nr:electron transfer flavoprotein subunit beta/FixA family protein [Planctomycetaceae bacterium]